MGNVVLAMSVSLDGFIAGPNDRPGVALGDGGQRLHEWISEPSGRDFLAGAVRRTGAVVMGRHTYDLSDGPHAWGVGGRDGYTPAFVVTHRPPRQAHPAFRFVTEGVDAAIAQAVAAAGDLDVGVMGADIGRQCLRAGLLDAMILHLIPVLLGDGKRLFDGLPGGEIDMEPTTVIAGSGVAHLRYRILTGTR